MVGALFLAMMVVIFLVMGVLGFGGFMGMMAGGAMGSGKGMMAGMGVGLFAMLVGLVLFMLVDDGAVVRAAAGGAARRGAGRRDAAELRCQHEEHRALPAVGHHLLHRVDVASIPFGLGWIVLVPVLMLTLYVSYKDVFST